MRAWLPDLDGDGWDELVVNGDDATWLEGVYFHRTVIHPGSVVRRGLSLADAAWDADDVIYGILDRERVVLDHLGSAGVAPLAALDDVTLTWDEIAASIPDAEPWPYVAGDRDVAGGPMGTTDSRAGRPTPPGRTARSRSTSSRPRSASAAD